MDGFTARRLRDTAGLGAPTPASVSNRAGVPATAPPWPLLPTLLLPPPCDGLDKKLSESLPPAPSRFALRSAAWCMRAADSRAARCCCAKRNRLLRCCSACSVRSCPPPTPAPAAPLLLLPPIVAAPSELRRLWRPPPWRGVLCGVERGVRRGMDLGDNPACVPPPSRRNAVGPVVARRSTRREGVVTAEPDSAMDASPSLVTLAVEWRPTPEANTGDCNATPLLPLLPKAPASCIGLFRCLRW